MVHKQTMIHQFDDSLGVMDQDLSRVKLLLFHGCSGSGKSSYLTRLQEHQSFKNHDHHWFYSDPQKFTPKPTNQDGVRKMALVDEVTKLSELTKVAKLTRRFDVVAVATHVHPMWFTLLRLRGPVRTWSTNGHPEKIVRYLKRLGHQVRESDVLAMCEEYGASYAVADIVREHHPSEDFGRSWAHFKSFATIKTQRNPAHRGWGLRLM